MKTRIVECGEHDLVIAVGDCEFHAKCACGKPLGTTKPDISFDVIGRKHERHVMIETTGYPDMGDE